MSHPQALAFAALALMGCSSRTPDAGPTGEAQAAADAAFVELKGGTELPLPGVRATADDAELWDRPTAVASDRAAAGEPVSDYVAKPGWFLVDTVMLFSGSVPPAQARQEVLQAARVAGLVRALPQAVSFTSLLSDIMDETAGVAWEKSTWSTFALSSVAGHVVDEHILSEQLLPMEGNAYRYRIVLDARVEPVKGERDPALRLELAVNDRLLKGGDDLVIRARSSVDGYLYLFYFLSDHSVMLLYPNRTMAEKALTAGDWMELPSQQQRARGLHFRVAADPNVATANETVYALFTRQPIAQLPRLSSVQEGYVSFTAGDASFTEFQRWLAEIPLGQRVEKAVQLHIISDEE